MAIHIRRRELLVTLASAAAAWPLSAGAQQATVPVIGFLGPGSAQSDYYRVAAFRQGLREAGLVEGRNFTIEYRWADSHYDRLPALATELVQGHVAVIASSIAEVRRFEHQCVKEHWKIDQVCNRIVSSCDSDTRSCRVVSWRLVLNDGPSLLLEVRQ